MMGGDKEEKPQKKDPLESIKPWADEKGFAKIAIDMMLGVIISHTIRALSDVLNMKAKGDIALMLLIMLTLCSKAVMYANSYRYIVNDFCKKADDIHFKSYCVNHLLSQWHSDDAILALIALLNVVVFAINQTLATFAKYIFLELFSLFLASYRGKMHAADDIRLHYYMFKASKTE